MSGRFRSRYRAGDWVRVRSREEILRTLDERGALDALPFMPEMLRFCGQRLQVAASAHKTCDTVHGSGGRRMRAAVHLEEARCDGSGHGGCQARCLIFWKEAWLEPAADAAPDRAAPARLPSASGARAGCDAVALERATCDRSDPASPTYSCQATRLFEATTALAPWSPMQYVDDVRSGNIAWREALKLLSLAVLYDLRRVGIGYRLFCALYEWAHRWLMGSPSPYLHGTIPAGGRTPALELGLQPGEYAEVRSVKEIAATLNERNRNRGMIFDKEAVRYCGQRFRVLDRVRRIVNETTGKMIELPNPSVILEGTYCTGRYSERRLLCPRRIVPYWREAWLRRVSAAGASRTDTGD
jgi:hypothetical protein